MSKTIKKNFFAPLALRLGAMRRAAMLLLVMMLTTATAWATDKTLSGSESYTAQDGDVLTGSTSGTVTIAADAKITLSGVTITGGIVCAGTAEITLVGTNSVNGASQKAGIQVGGSVTTLTIKGNGSLTANGGENSAGIGLSRAWSDNATGGDILIEGGNITATGNGMGAGIGTGVCYGGNSDKTATLGTITIKGGTVRAIGGTDNGNGIGKGDAYSNGHAVVGTITIYDGIDMVDASSISESIVYMHETTDVTANKIDYFTITEDGDRRVIVPKDNTDYTITIADGIEHGTLTGAATAKYMENVTITATPAFGYRFVRLIVKDSQNNAVATDVNTFLMPKGGATVSAEFAFGLHGTTEFTWEYYKPHQGGGPSLPVEITETIYDGVTTKNIQQTSYYIKRDRKDFLLDNRVYDVYIPYAGGTGVFTESDGATSFNFPNNGETGYYDVTLTEAANGKWFVSILKTAGQMDVVPDQTYTGSAITPEPLVLAGSLSLIKGTDYEYSYTNNTNFGTATVRATFQGTYASLGYVEKEFEIVPKSMTNNDISITIPEQTYTGSAIEPAVTVKDGETTLTLGTDYEVAYSNNVNAGTATVTITGKGNYSDSKEATFTISPRLARQAGAVYIYQDQNGMTALLDGTSVDPVDIDYNHNIIVNHVTSNRVFTPGMASTVMLPFNYTCNGEEGGTFYKFVGVKKENDKWVATMQETGNDANNEGTLEANTPYLFMPTATTMTFPNINGSVRLFTRDGGSGGNCETADPGSHWTFKGTYEYMHWKNDPNDLYYYYRSQEIGHVYGFAGVEKDDINVGDFVKVAWGAKIRPMRAYLLWNDMPNFARTRNRAAATTEELPQRITVKLISANDEVTGIGEIDTTTGEMSFDGWYTMDGVRLDSKPTTKGIYINNGKKVIIH